MHIGIDTRLTYYRDGGISTYMRELVRALAAYDMDNDYTIFQSRKDHTRLNQRFKRSVLWTPAHHRIERLALSVELAGRGLDVFHSPDFIAPYRGAKRHVITVHDLTFLYYPQYITAAGRQYYHAQIEASCQQAACILAVSHATKADLVERLSISAEKILVQPHGVNSRYQPLAKDDILPIQAHYGLPNDYILHVGTLEPRKNIIGLLEAYHLLLKKLPDCPPIVLVGRKGWLFQETERAIDRLDLSERVIWRDDVRNEHLPAIYNGALVNVTVSHYEGFGMPALEGMACGTVPIVSDRSSLPEVVGDVGLLVNPDEPQAIAHALEIALTDSNWRVVERQKAIARSQRFTWQQSAKIAVQAYTAC